ncbi:hypothetical protein [Yersinia rohdei]|uniref:hypothetical protein n=1 Tax=Yersinia rohdei TaxID=29485 RepID=UPI0011A6D82C|nr:hypothetical protein [Yersinia rohdei]
MTINIDSAWVLIGIGMALGFGGYVGLYAAIMVRKSCEWFGDKLGVVLFAIWYRIKRWGVK